MKDINLLFKRSRLQPRLAARQHQHGVRDLFDSMYRGYPVDYLLLRSDAG
jgi:hypothetical protein